MDLGKDRMTQLYNKINSGVELMMENVGRKMPGNQLAVFGSSLDIW